MAVPSRLAIGIFRFVLVCLLALALVNGTALLVAALVAWPDGASWDSPQCLGVGFVCGLIVWLFVATFHLRREIQKMPFSQRDQFVAKAKSVLQEMGYALTSQSGPVLSFRPRFHAYLFGGGIQLFLEGQEAELTGPKVSLEIFRRSFRMLNHVQRVQLYLQDHRKFTDNVVKRVELQLRLRPDQFEAMRENIIALLQKEASVTCELSLLVQSEKGIRENILEFQVRDWLEQNGIECDIRKDIVQFVEVVDPELDAKAADSRQQTADSQRS
jgi:hypothetical protein